MSSILQTVGIPTPKLLWTIKEGKAYAPTGQNVSIEDLLWLLPCRAFVKPRDSSGGSRAFLVTGGKVVDSDGAEVDDSQSFVLQHLNSGRWIVEEVIQQMPEYAAPSPTSVNTVRCITYRTTGEGAEVVGALWRMGGGRGIEDNATAGGVFVGVDVTTGVLHPHGFTKTGSKLNAHPGSGLVFENYELPKIQEGFDHCVAAHNALGKPSNIGWDIAMREWGPCIIEGNTIVGNRTAQAAGSDLPDRFWELFIKSTRLLPGGWPKSEGSLSPSQTLRVHLRVIGKVQKVGYHAWFRSYSSDKSIPATAQNLDDGSIRVSLIGARRDLEFMVLKMASGPRRARVTSIEFDQIDSLPFYS